MPNNEIPLICPFLGRRCIKDKCMMWLTIHATCCIPYGLTQDRDRDASVKELTG